MKNKSIFKNKSILITGHTGFKGSWLANWLKILGGNVIGVSKDVPTNPSHYELNKKSLFNDLNVDITNPEKISSIINKLRPDYIFHLAAQPIVFESYNNPLNTFNTNIMGTANVLDALRKSNHKCVAIIITSDKSYDNVEWVYGYRETDKLGGKDPYSGSKGGAELVIKSYYESFFNNSKSNIRLAIGRAGNVIGGGDWAPHRIVPDCVRSWSKKQKPEIRNPNATRPWQHVLEPLSGYISLAKYLTNNDLINGEAFNFGPPSDQNYSVRDLVEEIVKHWPDIGWKDKSNKNLFPHEAGLLKLNCDKAKNLIKWKSTLNFEETSKWTADWYHAYYTRGKDEALEMTFSQIEKFMSLAKERNSFELF
ncbi:MAG: CDP-glucose 4,6-dehydratase [Legionellales bacterium]|nr:CDP-glucose 4,6-dehydratase [Legionellales bacterium]|tara:strand:+ start:1577 stop:2674 length:1098 start_codon:yes stop_codon:yes gene_type:complete